MSTRTKKTQRQPSLKRGQCHVCGCTEDRGCDAGCSWFDRSQTLCTACARWSGRAGWGSANCPSKLPVYGLWIVDGGPRARGHWLMDTEDGDHLYPALFLERRQAEAAAKVERAEGLDVVAVELRAVVPGTRRKS